LVLIAFILCYSIFSTTVYASEIVSVQSINIKPYNNALKGFKTACSCNVKNLIVSEMQRADIVKKIYKTKPDLIIAIGIHALGSIISIKDIPIVYIMILDPQSLLSDKKNITGVSMHIDPEKQLSFINKILPDVKNIGLLYDPAKTGDFVKNAKPAATAVGIKLFAKKIHSSKDFPSLLKDMAGEINAFWMLPDLTAVTPETVEFLFLFSIENNLPVITFSKKYSEMGALISFNIDALDIGRQAWDIAEKILSGTDIKKMTNIYAKKIDIKINQITARKLGIIAIDDMLIKAIVANQE
jgi:putative ABC transport system substrate-binding protein